MLIRTEIDGKYKEIELHVCNSEETGEVRDIVHELHELYDRRIAGVDARGNRCMSNHDLHWPYTFERHSLWSSRIH